MDDRSKWTMESRKAVRKVYGLRLSDDPTGSKRSFRGKWLESFSWLEIFGAKSARKFLGNQHNRNFRKFVLSAMTT